MLVLEGIVCIVGSKLVALRRREYLQQQSSRFFKPKLCAVLGLRFNAKTPHANDPSDTIPFQFASQNP